MNVSVPPGYRGAAEQPAEGAPSGVPCGAPIIRARSPLRISFVGGGTDLPHWYTQHPGATLSSTINRYAHVSLYPRPDKEVHIHSVALGYTVRYNLEDGPVFDGVLDLAKAAIRRLGLSQGMELDVRSDAPPGSGLGGSSALTSAVIGTVAHYAGQVLTKYELAEMNHTIERVDLGIRGGKQDQYATAFGGFNLMEFYADRTVVNPLRVDRDIVNDLEAHLLLCFTGHARSNLGLIDKQVQFYAQGREETVRGMRRLYEMVFEMKEALLKGRLDTFGRMLNEAYVNKKRMNPEVAQGTIIDELYAVALAHGALGMSSTAVCNAVSLADDVTSRVIMLPYTCTAVTAPVANSRRASTSAGLEPRASVALT